MGWQYTPYFFPLIAGALISLGLAIFAWRHRSAPGASSFTALMGCVAWWSIGYAIQLSFVALRAKVIQSNINYIAIFFIPLIWLAFALQYVGHERWVTRRNLALLSVIPIILLGVIWTDSLHHWFRTDIDLVAIGGKFVAMKPTRGGAFWAFVIYAYPLILLGTGLILRNLIRSASVYRNQAIVMAVGALAPLAANALSIFNLIPLSGIDLTPFFFVITGLAMAWGIFRYQLLDVVPVARDTIIENMRDSVIVLDARKRIVDLNPAAQKLLGHPVSQIIGHPSQQVLAAWPALVEYTQDIMETQAEIALDQEETQLFFDLRISPLRGLRRGSVGWLIILHDITVRKRAEEALTRESELLQALMDNSPDYFFFKDRESRFTRTNKAHAQLLLGLDNPQEAAGKTDFDLFPQEEAQRFYDEEQEIIETGQPVIAREWSLHSSTSGEEVWLSEHKVPIRDETGEIVGLVCISRDITARRQAEEARERRAVQLQAAAEVSEAVGSILDPDKLVPRIVDLIHKRFDLYYVGLFLVEDGQVVLHAGTGEAGQKMLEAGHKLQVGGESMIGWCVANKKARIALDVGKEAVRFENPLLPETRSEMALPLVSRGEVIGALSIQSTEEADFSEEDVTVLQTMADQVANAITNARLYDEARRERSLLQALLDNSPDYLFFKDRESRFIRTNKAHAQLLLGLDGPQEAAGKTDFDLFSQEEAQRFYDEEQKIIETGQPVIAREWSLHSSTSGEEVWLSEHKVPIRDEIGQVIGLLGISRDVTQLKQAETALMREQDLMRTTNSTLEAILESIADGVIVFDAAGRATIANTAAAGLLGIHEDEIIGSDIRGVMVGIVAQVEQAVISAALESDPLPHPNVKIPWGQKTLSVSAAPMCLDSGEVIGNVAVFRDFTHEAEVDRMKSTFVSIASHELRAPLNAILGYAEMLREGVFGSLEGEQHDVVKRVLANTNQMMSLANNLLDQARMEAGQLSLTLTTFSPASLVDGVRDMMEITARTKELGLTSHVTDDVPLEITGDFQRLQQILVNLTSNAIKFTDEGRVDLRAYVPNPDHWALAVSDTGCGISEEGQKIIFEPFRRGKEVAHKYGGAGLGLSIAKQLVELMGGQLRLESEVGKGSVFTVVLPIRPA